MSSPRLLLMSSQSRQKTAFKRERTPASRWFLVSANISTDFLSAEMSAATLDNNTASFSICQLSKLPVAKPTLAPGRAVRNPAYELGSTLLLPWIFEISPLQSSIGIDILHLGRYRTASHAPFPARSRTLKK